MFRIKARIRKYLAEKKLRKSGYLTWQSYRHNRDDNVCRYANRISDFYSGYKYVHRVDNQTSYAYQCVADMGPGGLRFGYEDMRDWCEIKCRFRYRMDIHRLLKQTGLGVNGEEYPEWYFNDIGGTDYVYFAFQNEEDYVHFLLRWQ